MEILKSVLEENISYYKKLEREILARLINLPRGSIKKRKIGKENYYYLQQRKRDKVIQNYLGKSVPEDLLKGLEERKVLEEEIKKVRGSMKILREKSSSDILLSPLKELLFLLTKYGLWDEGVQIIGSWCFKIYQEYFGVEKFPLRTEDIDILIPLPYKGKEIRISALLKEIGFKEGFNPDGSMYFYQIGLRVDFVVPEIGRGFEEGVKINKLSLSAQALRFLDILFANPREINITRGIRVKVPAPSSFLLHKLIIFQRRKNKADSLKDMRQSICVAKSLIQDKKEREEIKKFYLSLPASWKKKVIKGINLLQQELPLEMEVVKEIEKILK